MPLYQQAAEKLISKGHAYQDEGAVRLKVPSDETVSYHDFVLDKDVSWTTNILTDMVLLKSDGFPTYHLANVVDDHEMKITHVLRGHDWLPSTPLHLLVYKYLDYAPPFIGHLTDIQSTKGGKLSKRRDSVSCEQFLADGYLPEAILNFVILLGWAPKDNRELFTLDEFVAAFDAKGFQKSNPLFLDTKLNWFNGHYIRQLADSKLLSLLKPFLPEITANIIPLIKDRLVTLKDVQNLAGFFFTRPLAFSSSLIQSVKSVLSDVSWDKPSIDKALVDFCDSKGYKRGDFFMDLRQAICGQKITPPLTESMLILGKSECLARLP